MKGLCVSVGGITESIVKYSLGALTSFISSVAKTENSESVFSSIFESAIKILKEFEKDERIVIPMFKMLDFILEKSEIQEWA